MSKKGLREKALEAIDKTKFWPERGRNRIASMVSDRPDWLISRQRSWGVPITLIIGPNGELHTDRADAESINNRILEAVRKYGVDGWFDTPLEEFIPKVNNGWHKVNDILDVWFDSGCTHAFCLKTRSDLPRRADLYLEGSDQHRGWFQSSLLESCAVYGEAPYDGVLTDGFVVDDKGLKMSKSLGNTMSPEDINKQYGAEILRLWVANSETTTDLKIGREIIQTNVDTYRKLRNTLRYMLGALDGYNLADTVKYSEMPGLEKWVLHRLSEITLEHERLVRDHDHKRIFTMLFNFCTLELSSFYFDIRKDALYCDPIMSLRRQSCLTVMDIIFQRLATWLAPVMCFTMEEVWKTRFPNQETSVHLQLFKKAPKEWFNQDIAEDIEIIRTFRGQVSEAIEPMRRDKQIKSSLEASVAGPKNSDLVKAASNLGISLKNSYSDPCNPSDTLADYLIVSICELSDGNNKIDVTDLKETGFNKCERSWKYFEGDGEITDRDAAAVEFFENNIEID
jgi:isoleucyl-tRNA synthetase